MKIALAQFNPTVGDFAGNASSILRLAQQAKARGADLAVFSELCVCGYLPLDLLERPSFLDRNGSELDCLAKKAPLPILVGYPSRASQTGGKGLFNAAALLINGEIAFEQHKMLLPTYDVFDESRYFRAATSQRVFRLGSETLGITICEDIWNDKNYWAKPLYETDPVVQLVSKGATVIINISASPFTLKKRAMRIAMLRSLAQSHNRAVVYVNQFGGDDSLVFDGGSMAVTADGRVAAYANAFAEDLVIFDTETGLGDRREQPADEITAALEALICGTRDYVRKCGFNKAIVGLSGGIDSSVVACIAAGALGADKVTGVAMPGPYSSEGSVGDARQLAANLGINFLILPMTEIFETNRRVLSDAFSGLNEDTTEENLQARIRGNLLMALSNKFGALVLSTGNKSEMAVGYCTLYGDMAGGLAVISDVPKTMVYELAARLNREREVVPRATIDKPPSAELRPNQTDQDSLPPYEVLDRILKAYVEDVETPEDISVRYGYPLELVRNIAMRVDRNEYKRKQAPPGLKITSRAFGFGRPFPIVQQFVP
jgi:NAD+ synthetase